MSILKSKIESLLFIAARPLNLKKISEQVGESKEGVLAALSELADEYKKDGRGIQILQIDDEYQMSTNPESAKIIKDFLKDEMTGELTRPALETLTIIAYRGPISKPELEQIRGVNCSLILRNLLIKGLAETKTAGVGGEALYSVTFDLLRHLGITKVEELPDYDKLSKSEILDRILNLTAEPIDNQQISV
ncbi:MAG TPA: SMC-Scp complex subunit ScpB [Patescibacteria group bacterium]|nr:SMC-Scp complex subunit ScpB [Patescibacteria group bacterium]